MMRPWSQRVHPVVRWGFFFGCGLAGLISGMFLVWLFGGVSG